jgi:hypothetical protein
MAQTGDATWTARFFGQLSFWSSAGGDHVTTASASASVGPPGFFYTWSSPAMAADVQAWLDSPSTNHGWLLRGNEASPTTARRFGSRQNGFDGFWPRLTVAYASPSTSVGATPDGGHVPGEPLTLDRSGSGDLLLRWGPSCVAGVDDYAVYQGSLGDFEAHAPITCSTAGVRSLTLPPPTGAVFWLVVPVDPEGGAEGSYGTASDGSERPPSATPCFPQSIGGETCPGD